MYCKTNITCLLYIIYRHVARGFEVSCVAKLMIQRFSECIYDDHFCLIPLLSLISILGCAYITGGCNSSTIQPTMANLRANQTPLCECLATCLIYYPILRLPFYTN